MPEGIFNQKELSEIKDLNKNLKTVATNIKDLKDTILKLNSKSNQNTLMYKLVEAIEKVATEIKNKETVK